MSNKEILETLIVKCNNCKHYKDEMGICDLHHTHGCAETWFCADGEPNDDAFRYAQSQLLSTLRIGLQIADMNDWGMVRFSFDKEWARTFVKGMEG